MSNLRSFVDLPIQLLQVIATTKERFLASPLSTLREQVSGRVVISPNHPHPRTDAQFEEYIHDNYFPRVDQDEFQKVIYGYPSGWF